MEPFAPLVWAVDLSDQRQHLVCYDLAVSGIREVFARTHDGVVVVNHRPRRLHRCRPGRRVGRVQGEHDALGEALAERGLLIRQRRPHGGDDVTEAMLVGSDDVHITLDYDGGAAAADVVLGPIEAVEHSSFIENRRLGRIHVLWPLLRLLRAARQHPAAEADDAAAVVPYRELYPVAKAVVGPPFALDEQAGLHQLRLREAARQQVAAQPVPARRRVAQEKVAHRPAVEAPLLHVGAGRRHVLEQAVIEERRRLVGVLQRPHLLPAAAIAAQLHARSLRQQAQRPGEVEVLLARDEGDDVAAGAAGAEAAPALAPRLDDERGRLLVVERAERPVVAPRLLQAHVAPDYVDDVEPRLYLLDRAHVPPRPRFVSGIPCPSIVQSPLTITLPMPAFSLAPTYPPSPSESPG